uniref:DNA polymerase kappa n=1 Tax=Meloidogyne floridensis TaxID=298350 RepID=A0A915NIS7_9BILA
MALTYCGDKAGMASLDMNRIKRIIADNTGQDFQHHERQVEKQVEERIKNKCEMLLYATNEQLKRLEEEADSVAIKMEEHRSINRFWVHIDMDAFYASVECRDNPELRTVPMAVGGDAMLATSNYLARKFGVRSAMPGFIAKKLCPDLVIVPCDMHKYIRESNIVRSIFQYYDPNMFMGGLDEAYLDLTDFVGQRIFPVKCKRIRYTGDCICRLPLISSNNQNISEDAERVVIICNRCNKERIAIIDYIVFGTGLDDIVNQIRFEVEQLTGLTCSAGIATNKMLAKICTDLNKPNGQFYLEADRYKIIDFMNSLKIRKVPGIGPKCEAVLKSIGVEKCSDLFEKRAKIRYIFTNLHSEWLLKVSLGLDAWEIDKVSNQKSAGIGRSFTPKQNFTELCQILYKLCRKLIKSLPSSRIVGGRSATLSIKFATFDYITRCKSVDFVIQNVEMLYPIVEGLLKKELVGRHDAIRLLEGNIKRKHKQLTTTTILQQNLHKFIKPIKLHNNLPILDELGNEKIETTSNESEEDELNDDSIVVISSCGDGANGEEGLFWEYIFSGYLHLNLWLPGIQGCFGV